MRYLRVLACSAHFGFGIVCSCTKSGRGVGVASIRICWPGAVCAYGYYDIPIRCAPYVTTAGWFLDGVFIGLAVSWILRSGFMAGLLRPRLLRPWFYGRGYYGRGGYGYRGRDGFDRGGFRGSWFHGERGFMVG